MKTIIKFLLALFVLSVLPTTYVVAQVGHIESPLERKARLEREEAARKKKQQQEAAARKKREQEARERAAREAEEAERMRPFRELETNMVYVEGGTFMMGATSDQGLDTKEWEKPVHQVTLSSYYICKYEVTQDLWEAVMGSNPSYFKGGKLPVEQVSWEDCQVFITKLNQLTGKNYRLPTEAEWEYAARGGKRSNGYKYAGGNSLDDVAWHYGNCGTKSTTHDVGTKRFNELGLYDMSGNVEEWCQDWYGFYSSESQTNPRGATSSLGRVIRGGAGSSLLRDGMCLIGSPATRPIAVPTSACVLPFEFSRICNAAACGRCIYDAKGCIANAPINCIGIANADELMN